jgi:protein-S-isoprenylcysteine O-methyltransferase Ste14
VIGKLQRTVASRYVLGLIVVGLLLFAPAGSLDYWEAWLYIAVIFAPMLFVLAYLLRNDPALLERRMMYKEKEAAQKKIIGWSAAIYLIGFLTPGFDHRFGWSDVPWELSAAADTVVFLGYVLFFLVLRENSYASRVVKVEAGQKVISSGPYAVVRHPMYLATIVMFLATPVALGSYWALLPFLLLPPFLVLRIRGEEKFLEKELPGYLEYTQKVRYRLIPYVW